MRAVLGVFVLLVGFTVGYMVLAGKLPAPAKGSGGDPASTQSTPAVQPGQYSIVGLPTMAHLDDLISSNGGMR